MVKLGRDKKIVRLDAAHVMRVCEVDHPEEIIEVFFELGSEGLGSDGATLPSASRAPPHRARAASPFGSSTSASRRPCATIDSGR